MKTARDESEAQTQVDNHIITACITLIAAHIVILTIHKPAINLVSYSSLGSLTMLILSFLLCLWHRARYPIRVKYFEEERERQIHQISGEIEEFFKLVQSSPVAMVEMSRATAQQKTGVVEPDHGGPYAQRVRASLTAHLNVLENRMKESYKAAFEAPLREKYGGIKHGVDNFAKAARYSLFVIGIVFFFISMFISLI